MEVKYTKMKTVNSRKKSITLEKKLNTKFNYPQLPLKMAKINKNIDANCKL